MQNVFRQGSGIYNMEGSVALLRRKLSRFEIKKVHGLDNPNKKVGGEGSYGAVYEVTVNRQPCYAKQLHSVLVAPDIRPEERQGIYERFHKECLMLSELNHENIVKFVGVYFGSSREREFDVSLIMEKLDTDLSKYLRDHPNVPLCQKLTILLDVSVGLLYLHSRQPPIIHRDLTTGNILLTTNLQAKIADFGVSRALNISPNRLAAQTKCPGTLAYMPPEALQQQPVYGKALDIFSFGEVCLCTIHQKFAEVFDVTNEPDMPSAHFRGELEILKRKKWIDDMPSDHCLRGVLINCLQDKQNKRPTTQQLNESLTKICVEKLCAEIKKLKTLQEKENIRTVEADIKLQSLEKRNAELSYEMERVRQELVKAKKEYASMLEEERSSHGKAIDQVRQELEKSKKKAKSKKLSKSEAHEALVRTQQDNESLREDNARLNATLQQVEEQFARMKISHHDLKKKKKLTLPLASPSEQQRLPSPLTKSNTGPTPTTLALQHERDELRNRIESLEVRNKQLEEQLQAQVYSAGHLDEGSQSSTTVNQSSTYKSTSSAQNAISGQKYPRVPFASSGAWHRVIEILPSSDDLTPGLHNMAQGVDNLTISGQVPLDKPSYPQYQALEQSVCEPNATDQSIDCGQQISPTRKNESYYPIHPKLSLKQIQRQNYEESFPQKQIFLPLSFWPEEKSQQPSPQQYLPNHSPNQPQQRYSNDNQIHSRPPAYFPGNDLVHDPSNAHAHSPDNRFGVELQSPSSQGTPKKPVPRPRQLNPHRSSRRPEGSTPTPDPPSPDHENPNPTRLLVEQNTLHDNINEEISGAMAKVSEVTKNEKESAGAPLDPNLVCPMCMKQFCIGEIQRFRAHANKCDRAKQ